MDDSDIIVRLIQLPGAIRGFTSPSSDGIYNVYINKDLSPDIRHKVFRHEINHIKRNDFASDKSVEELEADGWDADL